MEANANSNRPRPKLDRRNAMKNIAYDADLPTSSLRAMRSLDLDLALSDNRTSFRIEGIDGEFDLICRSLGFSGPEDFAIPTAVWEEQKARSRSYNFDSPSSTTKQVEANEGLSLRSNDKVRVSNHNSDSVVKQEFDDDLKLKNKLVNFGNDTSVRVVDNSSSKKQESNGSPKLKKKLGIFGAESRAMVGDRGGNDNSKLENGLNLANIEVRERVNLLGDIVNNSDWIKRESNASPKLKKLVDFGTENGVGFCDERENGGSKLKNGFKLVNAELASVSAGSGAAGDDGGGGGIKGERPPPLVPPPPVRLRPVVDTTSSTWDIFNSFAPQEDEDLVSPVQVGFSGRLDEEDGVIEENEVVNGGTVQKERSNGVRLGERETDGASVPQTCTASSGEDNDDDDANGGVFNLIVDTVYNTSPGAKLRRHITAWQKGELLGSGSFGTVYEGYTDDGYFFAVKEVSLLDQGSQGKQSIFQLEQEISLLSQFEHENIVQYLGTDKDDSKLYIFLELVTKGSLLSLYQKFDLRDSQVSGYTRQILSGLKYLHDRNVVHRDIKCANILVDVTGSVKLADFGLAKATKMNDVKSSKGSPYWMAPEVVNLRNRGYGLAADIWSLGCTVLEMLTRQPPYSHLEGMQALFRIGRGEPPPIPDSLSVDARDFILRCIQVNPNARPTAAQLLEHPFVKRPLSTPALLPSPRHHGVRS